MSESKELLPVDKVEILEHLRSEDALTPLVDKVKDLVSNFEHDLSTKTGQKKTASISRKVSNFKVRVVDIVNDYTADEKARLKKITSNLTSFKLGMDEQRDIARQPLTDFEYEEARKAAEEKERLAAEAIAKEKEREHELAIWEDREFDRVKAEEAAELKRIADEEEAERVCKQAERDKEIADKAKADAEAELNRVKAEAENNRIKRHKDAIFYIESYAYKLDGAPSGNINACICELRKNSPGSELEEFSGEAMQAYKDTMLKLKSAYDAAVGRESKIEADNKAAEKARLETAAEAARLAEVQRQIDEEKRIADEKSKLEKDRAHVGKISKAAKEHIMLVDGVSEDLAIAIVKHLRKNKINEISINF